MASATVGNLRAVLSADTGEFTKAMASASGTVKALAASLQSDLEPRQRAVNAAVKDFLGGNEKRRAEEYAQAVERIGGASALTAQDQAKVNRVVTEAIGHYKALGEEAPQHLVKLQQQTAQVSSAWEKADQALGAFGLSLSGITVAAVGAGIVALGKEAVEFGSHLTDLRDATGLTLQELQRLDFAGGQVGVSVDAAAKGVQRLQRALIEDKDGGAAGAIKKLGLDVASLTAMSPGQMFESMSKAIAGLPTPAERTTAALQILGKSGTELLPLMLGNIEEMTAGMRTMSDRTVEAADRFDDAWARMKKNLRAEVGEMIGAVSSLSGAMDFAFKNDGRTASWLVPFQRMGEVNASLEKFAATATGPVAAAVPVFGATGDALDDMMAASQRMTKETEAAIVAHEAHVAKIKAIADVFTGKDLTGKIRDYAEALRVAEKQGGLTAYQQSVLGKELNKLVQQGAILPPKLREVWLQEQQIEFNAKIAASATEILTDRLDKQTRAALGAAPAMQRLTIEMKGNVGGIKELLPQLDAMGTKVKSLPAPPEQPWRDWFSVANRTISDLVMAAQRGSDGILLYASGFARDFVSTALDIMVPGLGQIVTLAWPLIEKGLAKIWDGIQAFWNGIKGIFNFFGSGTGAQTPVDGYNPNDPNNPFYGREDPGNPNPTPALPEGPGTGDLYVPSEGLTPYEEYLRQREIVYGMPAGFAKGTYGRFLNFGSATATTLHGDEAVVPQSSVPTLAEQLAAAWNNLPNLGSYGSMMAPAMAGGGSAPELTFVAKLYLDSRQIAEATVPKLGQVMERLRLT